MSLRFGMAAHLIEHCPLHVENTPIRIVGRVGALERRKRLLILAGIRQRAPVSPEQRHAPWIADRGLLQDRHGLGTLVGCPQSRA